MSDHATLVSTRASGKKSSASKAVKRPTPLPEGDKLAMEAAHTLQTIALAAIYDESNQPRELSNHHLSEVDHLLGRLLAPEYHEWSEGDPQEGHLADHLACISSELEAAIEVMKRGIPGFGVDAFLIPLASATYAYHYADELFAAYNGLPGTLEALRALTTQAGAHAAIERHLASDLTARLRADVPAQQSATADAPNADEKLVAATVVSQLRAAYDQYYKGLHVDASCLLTTAIDELDAVLEDRKSEGAIHLASSLINGCIHIERAADVDSLIAAALEAQYAILESASISYGFGQGGCEALATGIRAGVKRHRDPPQPPIRRVEANSSDLTQAQYKTVLECVAGDASTLHDLLMLAQRNDDEWSASIALNAAETLSKKIGAMADGAVGGGIIGDVSTWLYGRAFKDSAQGGAA